MFNSKALKPKKFRWQYEEEEKNLMQNLVFYSKKFFIWPITDNYRRTKERVLRSYDYARFGWLNFDFDFAYVYHLLEFKLKRVQKCLKNGVSVQEPEDTAALKELIKIVERLGKGEYDERYRIEHDKIWGKLETKTTPNYDDKGKVTGYAWNSWRKNCPEGAPKKIKDKERKEFMACYELAENDRIRDIKRLSEILIHSSPKFWD
jgi:hypothetical protein